MCQSIAEGGRRCGDNARLAGLTLDEIRPEPRPGVEDVDWGQDPAAPADLFARFDSEVAASTVALLHSIAAHEPAITADVESATAEAGCRLYGLAFRIKSPASLARKITSKVDIAGGREESVAGRLSDVIRFTALTEDHDELVAATRSTAAGLSGRGWTLIEAEHSYTSGAPYKGIHTVWRHPGTGQLVEVQVHSRASQQAKDESHPDYEIARNPATPPDEADHAYQRSVATWEHVPAPEGIKQMMELEGHSVKTKTYR